MKSNINENPLKEYAEIPSVWDGKIGYQYDTDNHYADGWRDIIVPSYNSQTEKLGGLILDGDDVTYEVITKTQQEIEAEMLAEADANSQNALQNYMKGLAISQAQEMDDEDALANADLFPFWVEDTDYNFDPQTDPNPKVRFWNEEHTEIWLWKCIQGHISQSSWKPYDVPALWMRIAEEGQILKWVQPLGQHDAYQTGEKVYWPEPEDIWESTVNNNVWEPGVYGWNKIS